MKTYKLKRPVVLGEKGEPITELHFREEIVAGDMRGIPVRVPPLWDDYLKLAARLTGQPDAVINKLCFADLQEVAAIVDGFTGPGPETGSASSAT